MFARTLKVFGIGIALIGESACRQPDCASCGEDTSHFTGVARAANVVPMPPDTTPRGSVHLIIDTTAYWAVAYPIPWTSTVTVAPLGTIDSIALYEVAIGQALPASATAILCAGAAACAITSGTVKLVPPATVKTIWHSARVFGTQVVFFTTTAQKAAGGAMRGVVYFDPYPS
jgi:hypothetical protein